MCFLRTILLYVHRSEVSYGGRGRESEGSTANTARKRPKRPWTAARTIEVLRPCPLAIDAATCALRNCCFNCRAGQSHEDNVRCTAVEEQPEAKELSPTFAAQLHLPTHDLFWAKVRVQPHLPPLRSLDLAWNPVKVTAKHTYTLRMWLCMM